MNLDINVLTGQSALGMDQQEDAGEMDSAIRELKQISIKKKNLDAGLQ